MNCFKFSVGFILGFTLLTQVSCGKSSGGSRKGNIPSMKLALKRVSADNGTNLNLTKFDSIRSQDTEIVTNDVTITSLKYPIGSIAMSDADRTAATTASGNKSFKVYQCSGATPDDCLVELAQGSALANLLADAPNLAATEGDFTQINISPCVSEGQSANFKLTATAIIDEGGGPITYYTKPVVGLSTTGPAEEITIPSGITCGGLNSWLLNDLVIKSGGFATKDPETSTESEKISTKTIPLQLYFDIANAATASGGTSNVMAGKPGDGCLGANSQDPYICLNFPDVVGTVDETTPTVKRFLIQDTGGTPKFQNMVFGMYFGADTTVPFGIYSRPFFNNENRPTTETLIGSCFSPFVKNADGTVKIDTLSNWLKIDNFTLATHTGSMVLDKSGDPAANPSSQLNGTVPYSATLLP